MQHQEVVDALPILSECRKLPRDYIGNVIYTLVGDPFQAWVKQFVDQRHTHKRVTKKTTVKLDSRVVAALRASNQISGRYPLISYCHIDHLNPSYSYSQRDEALERISSR